MIEVSVPGKIHLLGEHSVVYGKPALLAAINLRLYFAIGKGSAPKEFKELKNPQLKRVLEKGVKKKFPGIKIPQYKAFIKSELPMGSGLGSSASLSVAYACALLTFLKVKYDSNLIYEIAYSGERLFHGNPSGGDITVVNFGGIIYFRKELDFLKTISPLSFKISPKIKKFLLVDSGKPKETTKQMVELTKLNVKSKKLKMEAVFDDQERLVKQLALVLKEGDDKKIIQIIKEGERNLEKIGVVGKKAKAIIKEVEKLGGAAKISGAGGIKKGSGMILAYYADQKKLIDLTKRMSLNYYLITIGEEGAKVYED